MLIGLGASLQPAQTWGALCLVQEGQGLLLDEDIVIVTKVELVGVRMEGFGWWECGRGLVVRFDDDLRI